MYNDLKIVLLLYYDYSIKSINIKYTQCTKIYTKHVAVQIAFID